MADQDGNTNNIDSSEVDLAGDASDYLKNRGYGLQTSQEPIEEQ